MIAWLAPLALAAGALWLAYRAAQFKAVADRLAAQCSDYIAYVSRAAMREDGKNAWLANRHCAAKREAVLAAFRSYYRSSAQPYPEHLLARDIPSLQDPACWKEMQEFVAAAREQLNKHSQRV